MNIPSSNKILSIVLLSAIALMGSGCAQYNKWAAPYGLDMKPVDITVFEHESDGDRRLRTPEVQPTPVAPPAVGAPQSLIPQPEIKPVEAAPPDTKATTKKAVAKKKAKKTTKKKATKKKKSKLPPCDPKPAAAPTPAPEAAAPQTDIIKDVPAPKAEQKPAKRELWCYSTLGEPECFTSPQPNAAERLINVDPPSSRPDTRQEYQERVSDTATKSQ